MRWVEVVSKHATPGCPLCNGTGATEWFAVDDPDDAPVVDACPLCEDNVPDGEVEA